ncbi:hypothetical protein BD309DRAFT_886759 [Dichomitus squalens]|uniref:Uncharacterized protein n=1 Tax=Dichomitus squalens TaxID=114155 RepID=A0A4Q9MUF0_9APHY|nr:hypothetical protein BD311DRAFT_752013 [Dichomitus squalens]TBU47300.1 hypothetical protein BD309DRAFT_886759 [Dichomitus squalens]
MPMRHAQRKHIIHSLSSLLYQLHTVSFLLSPRLWPLLCRIATQFQFSRPRDIDSQRSLRFWFILVVLVNLQSFYNHIFKGPAEGRSIILDFVGLAHKPSKVFLLSLDSLIVFLEFILIIIAYETSFVLASPPDTSDPLLPHPIPPSSALSLTLGDPDTKPLDSTSAAYNDEPEYIVDIRLGPLLRRLRNPPTPPPPQQNNPSDELLPLPNTTSFQLSQSLNMLARARARMRERAARAADNQRTDQSAGESDRTRERQSGEPREERTVPGGLREEGEDGS